MSITPSSFDCFNQFGPKNISPDPVNNPEIFKYFAETCRNDPTRNSNNFLDLFNPRNLDGSISTQISKDFMLKENDSFITSDSKVVGQRGPAARQIHQKIEHMKEDSQKLNCSSSFYHSNAIFLTLLSFSTAFQFWQVTDVHYDANYLSGSDPSTVCRSGTGSAGRIGDYSCDTNNFILNSVPKFVQRMSLSKNNRILLYNGDIFPRKIPDYDLDYLKEGLDNATNFLNKFTNFEIIPMLGNHDALPENYHDETTTDVFEYGAKAYSKWLTESAANTFKKGGYYTQKINNAGDDVYVVVLNTVLYYTFNDLTANKVDPIDQFDWFNNTMNTYREEGKTVLLAAHVCPGVSERYNWSQQMYDQYDDRLIDLIADYEDITIGLVCGHLHLDTYRIMKNDEGKVVIGYMSPSLDAYLGINPSVRLYDVEGKTVMNYVNYYVDLSKSYVEWKFNYNAIEEYGLNDLSADSMVELANRMHTDRSLHDIWYHHLRANTDQYSCDDKCYNNNLCAIEHPKNSEISCYEW